MSQESTDPQSRKRELRTRAEANRQALTDRDSLSRLICRKLLALDEYTRARVVLAYVDFATEVQTRDILEAAWRDGKRLVVPYCTADRLELFALGGMDELAAGTFGILEPKARLRGIAARRVEIDQVDLVVMPGVAFDARCGRLGHGRGYFDKLLRHGRPDTRLVAPAFDCQLFSEVPMLPHDVHMHVVVTETTIHRAGDPADKNRHA